MNPLHTAATGQATADTLSEHLAQIARCLAWLLWTSLLGGAALLASRRLAGALVQPLEVHWLAAAGLGTWGVCFLAGLCLEHAKRKSFRVSSLDTAADSTGQEEPISADQAHDLEASEPGLAPAWLAWPAKLSVLVVALSLSVPGVPVGGLVVLWGIVLLGLVAEPWLRGRLAGSSDSWQGLPLLFPKTPAPSSQAFLCPISPPEPKNFDLEHWPESLLEHIVRMRSADGSEVRTGWVRVEFSAGQRTAAVHIGFCPPFAHTPRVSVEQAAGPPVRLKTTHLYPYGLRVEAKREPAAEQSAWVLLQFIAQSPAASEGSSPESAPPSPPTGR